MSVLEDLVAAAQELHPKELQTVRAMPRDYAATDEVDWDDVAKKADLDEGETLVDVAVRGDSKSTQFVTFRVEGADERITSGFFPLADIKKKSRATEPTRPKAPAASTDDGAAKGGTATVPVDPTGTGDPDDQFVPPPEGVPKDIADFKVKERVALIESPPEGVDAKAVADWEAAQEDSSPTVIKAAQKAGLLPADD